MPNIRVFVSFSHKNDLWIRSEPHDLIPWLAEALRRDGVEFWYDPELKNMPGVNYKEMIENEIDKADLAVLLISQDFIISDFIRDIELPRVKRRLDNKELLIIPILVGHVTWEGESEYRWLTDLQIIPGKPTPLIEYKKDDADWQKVRIEILNAIKNRIRDIRKKEEEQRSNDTNNSNGETSDPQQREKLTKYKLERFINFFRSKRKKIAILFLALIIMVLFTIYGLPMWIFPKTVSIFEPKSGSIVAYEFNISGTVPRGITDVWIVVNPVGSDEFWVQPKATIVKNGWWRGQAFMGRPGLEDLGKNFKVRAFYNTLEILREGDVLESWPSASHYSEIVEVIRGE
jgi:hypothetical protein